MMRVFIVLLAAALPVLPQSGLKPVVEVSLGTPLGQLRAVPLSLGRNAPPAVLLAYGPDVTVDPYHEMFFYPRGTLHFAVLDHRGRIRWKKDLGRGVVPGIWFTPVFPFDLDGDGTDEIWFVNNIDADHPLSIRGQRLERLDARTGESTGRFRWPPTPPQSISHTYRNFILGGMVKGRPMLVTAQGTYGRMALQGWKPDMTPAWEHEIPAGPGPRGSHMCAVADLDSDGVEEVLWGERVIEFSQGRQVACGDCDNYNGHSDVVQPFLDRKTGRWHFFTCRESDPQTKPRIAAFDASGKRMWGDLEKGHIDVGWVAQLAQEGRPVALGIRIGTKSLGPKGLSRTAVEEFLYDAVTGVPRKLPYSVYQSLPVDIDGDGMHELAVGGKIRNAAGDEMASFTGTVALAAKFWDLPGEQLLTWTQDGMVRVWANPAARDSRRALERYAHPFYKANRRLTATGSNHANLGGL